MDNRISSRTKGCTGDSDLEENVFFSGKPSCFFFVVVVLLAIKGPRSGFYHVTSSCFIEDSCGYANHNPGFLPSFLPNEDLACGVKRERGEVEKKVKEKCIPC